MPSRRVLLVILVVLIAIPLLAMSEMTGGQSSVRAPKRNFTGSVTDRKLVTLKVEHMHCEGRTSINGFLGDMRIKLKFDDVRQITFTPADSGFTQGTVTFRDGQTKNMQFKNLTRCYGTSELGEVMVQVRDLRQVDLDPPPPEPTPEP